MLTFTFKSIAMETRSAVTAVAPRGVDTCSVDMAPVLPGNTFIMVCAQQETNWDLPPELMADTHLSAITISVLPPCDSQKNIPFWT